MTNDGVTLTPKEIIQVQTILKSLLPDDAKVWVFGSRSTGKAKPYSDLDLAISIRDSLISIELINELNTAFEFSSFPYKVDIIDLQSISDEFKQAIKDQLKPFNWQT